MSLTAGSLSFLWGREEKERMERTLPFSRTVIKTENVTSVKVQGGRICHAISRNRELQILFSEKGAKPPFCAFPQDSRADPWAMLSLP